MRKLNSVFVPLGIAFLLLGLAVYAQQPSAGAPEASTVSGTVTSGASAPRLVKFSGALKDASGQPLSGVVGVAFALYKDQQGGTPLWLETQNLSLDSQGNYSVLLGSTISGGMPLDLFASGESRWLGVAAQLPGEVEQPRVLLVSVPYALKAADADTLGGQPLSAFVLTNPAGGDSPKAGTESLQSLDSPGISAIKNRFHTNNASLGGSSAMNSLAKWLDSGGTVGNSAVYESNGLVGIGTASPGYNLHVLSGNVADIRSEGLNYAKFSWKVDSGGADQKAWQFFPQTFDNSFVLETLNDAENAAVPALQIFRGAGTAITSVTFPNGNVGIGTANPGYNLHVKSGNIADIRSEGLNYAKFSWKVDSGGVDQKAWQFFPQTFDNSFVLETLNDAENAAVPALQIFRGTGTAITSVTFPNGKVGIGTPMPGYQLDVQGGQINASGGLCIAGTCQTSWNSFSGMTTFTAPPTGSTVDKGSLYVNPATAGPGQTLLGVAVGGTQKFLVDSGGSITTAGNINLPNTASANAGVITLGGNRFLHNFGTGNTFVGRTAGNFTMDSVKACCNTATGQNALFSNTTGAFNTATGFNALVFNTTGNDNTATGNDALEDNSSGGDNTVVGFLALSSNTTGNYNTAMGSEALWNNQKSCCNTAVGYEALAHNVVFTPSQENLDGGTNNTAVGYLALSGPLFNPGGGNNNTALGSVALASNSGGNDNTAMGYTALSSNSTGFDNTATGSQALSANTSGIYNTATGYQALSANTTACCNTAMGNGALSANTTGEDNTAMGVNALASNTIGNGNTAVGLLALDSNTGSGNTAIGSSALQSNTNGNGNTATGSGALASNTGCCNTATGASALAGNTTGIYNAAMGWNALLNNAGGSHNTAMGPAALYGNTGDKNTAVGDSALWQNTTGNSNIAVGYGAGGNLTTGDNNIDIGSGGLAGEANTIRIGLAGTQTQAFIAGIWGVNVGGAPVLVTSNGQLGMNTSSRRFKYDIQDMGTASADLLKLRPVTFRYKQAQDDGSHPLQYGLIAEEVAEVMPELVAYDKDGQPRTVLYNVLPSLLLNEVQRQNAEIAALNTEVATLREQVETLQKKQTEIQQLRADVERLKALEKAQPAALAPAVQ